MQTNELKEANKVCLQCSKEFKALRASKRFCSSNCKLKYNRNKALSVSKQGLSVSDSVSKEVVSVSKPLSVSSVSVSSELSVSDKVRSLSRYDLYDAISWYPSDTWIDSPEFLELQRRLRVMSYEELREKGYNMPLKIYKAHMAKAKV